MKVLYVITDFGSFNNFLGESAIELAKKGNEVFVICSQQKIIDVENRFDYSGAGINIRHASFPRSFSLLSYYKASKRIQHMISEIQPDIISIHFTTGMLATLFLGKLKIHTIGTFHGLGFPIIDSLIKKTIFKAVEYFCFNKLDEIWVLNNFDFELIRRTRFKEKLFLLPTKGLGCNLGKFNPNLFSFADKIDFRNTLGIGLDDFVLAFTGRFVDFKGFHKVLKSVKLLEEQYGVLNMKLLLMGGRDPIHSSGLTDEEETWMENSSLIRNIGFTSNVDRYLAITDLFVFPSEKEGMPVCIIESLAMGVPVLTTNTRGCNDLVAHDVNGVLVESRASVESISLQILELMKDSARMLKLGENALLVRKKMDRQSFVEQQIEHFETIQLRKH